MQKTMTKLLAVAFAAIALSACSSWNQDNSMGNRAETRNSTDANKSGNRAAASPGTGSTSGTGTGTGVAK
jgi:uncharacterized lipoprotein